MKISPQSSARRPRSQAKLRGADVLTVDLWTADYGLTMHFHVRKRRTTPAVIIVALIDVLIVLVIFLLVTTTFKQHPQLKLTLPESSEAKKAGATENTVVEVAIDKEGQSALRPERRRDHDGATGRQAARRRGEKSAGDARHQRRHRRAVGQGRESA